MGRITGPCLVGGFSRRPLHRAAHSGRHHPGRVREVLGTVPVARLLFEAGALDHRPDPAGPGCACFVAGTILLLSRRYAVPGVAAVLAGRLSARHSGRRIAPSSAASWGCARFFWPGAPAPPDVAFTRRDPGRACPGHGGRVARGISEKPRPRAGCWRSLCPIGIALPAIRVCFPTASPLVGLWPWAWCWSRPPAWPPFLIIKDHAGFLADRSPWMAGVQRGPPGSGRSGGSDSVVTRLLAPACTRLGPAP